MKKIASILLVLSLVVGLLVAMPINTSAASFDGQGGVEVTLDTNKYEYTKDEEIEISINITNNNSYRLEGVSLETLLPEGLELKEGQLSEKDLEIGARSFHTAYGTAKLSDSAKTVGGTASNKDSNADGSASSNTTTIILWIVLIVLLGAAAFGIVLIFKIKKANKLLSLFLCLALTLGMLPLSGLTASAVGNDIDPTVITVDKTIVVDNRAYTITSEVVFFEDPLSTDCVVIFNTDGGTKIESQTIPKGTTVTTPENPEKEGNIFIGWYTDRNYTQEFDFSKPVNKSCTVYARWLDLTDATDTDGDGLTNAFENYYKTNPSVADTDGDGLSDYIEVAVVAYDPLSQDSDNDGVLDGQEDYDNDGLVNKKEIELGTSLANVDTDTDGLKDKAELDTYKTKPAEKDTDKDGVSDGKEIELGTNPLAAQSTFDVKVSATNNDSVKPSVNITLSGNQVETLRIDEVNNESFFPSTMPGYLGKAYDFSVYGEFSNAVISFEFDKSALKAGADPVICYFNEETQEFEELATTIKGNVASATVTHFSKYLLIDRKVYEDSFSWTDVWDNSTTYTDVEVVLVIDDSGSMDWNDEYNQRLEVAKTLIDKLPKNSKIGVVKFSNSTYKLTEAITSDKELAKSFLTTSYFRSSGGTYMYRAIENSFNLFQSKESTTMKMMVVLSDGETSDTYLHTSVVETANASNIRIYTVGLGDESTEYFNKYLKPLATNTGAMFYLASDATQLADIYKDINEKIDIETDSDKDGIPDYYEDNMICFNGVSLPLDKNNPDTDGDGIDDGKELELKYEYNADRTQVKVTGKIVKGNPAISDTDGDGYLDGKDNNPLTWDVSDRDLAMLSTLVYQDYSKFNIYDLSKTSDSSVNKDFYGTATIKELKNWKYLYPFELKHENLEGGLCYGVFARDNNVVVAIRGTVGGAIDFINSADGRYNYIYLGSSDPGTDMLLSQINDIVKAYVQPGCKLYITGHSRGGMLAQRAAAGLVQGGNADKIERVTYFNGMGIVFAVGAWGVGRGWYDSLKSISHKVTRYNVKGDWVDGLGVHVVNSTASYDLTRVAKDNYGGDIDDIGRKHAMCNFTFYLMPERFKRQ